MARPPDPVRRQELLDQVVRYLADHGLAGASLRPMAKALGVSLNGLVHHFGTKTDLLVAALARANELQQRESEGWLACNPALLIDMSPVGAQVVSTTLLKPNQRVRLSFVESAKSVRFSAGVAWSSFELPKGTPRYRAGIEFFDADADAVSRFCETNRSER